MSGFAGLYYTDGRSAAEADVTRMTERLSHRGPDGDSVWCAEVIGLGHQLLRTTPESRYETLPRTNDAGDVVITADARIDNRHELFDALDIATLPEKTPDSHLILAAYEAWGEQCPEHLVGAFSFVIWDERNEQVFCARDHMGIKPFYYYQSEGVFAFGSEIKALLCLDEVPRRLNEIRVGDYLMSTFDDTEITFYEDVLRLPPGHRLIVSPGRMSLQEYWSLDPSCTIELDSDEEYAQRLRELFTEAVRCRLRSAYPVGSTLSGGLDSSSIVCTAQQLLAADPDTDEIPNGELHLFSAIFDDVPASDEREYIDRVLARTGLDTHYVHADRVSPLVEFDRVSWHEDEPFFTSNLFIHWELYRAAHRQDVRVFLDGFDGDTTISHGIGRLAELARAGRWLTLAIELDGLSGNLGAPARSIARRHVIGPLASEPMQRLREIGPRRVQGREDTAPLVNDKFATRIDLDARIEELQDRSNPPRTVRKRHHQSLTRGIIPFALEVADKAAAAFSIEPRYPFFDKRLVEFCLALPADQKQRSGLTRVVMRRAMNGILPPEIQWRGDKADLSPNFNHVLLRFERDRIEHVIDGESTGIEEYADMTTVRDAYARFELTGDHEAAIAVWKVVTLALWLRHTQSETSVTVDL